MCAKINFPLILLASVMHFAAEIKGDSPGTFRDRSTMDYVPLSSEKVNQSGISLYLKVGEGLVDQAPCRSQLKIFEYSKIFEMTQVSSTREICVSLI